MSTTTRHEEPQQRGKNQQVRSRRPVVVLSWITALLGVVVLGLLGWILIGDDSQDLTPEQQQMIKTIDAYIEAWNTGDGAAADAVMDPNGYLEDVGGRWYVTENGHKNYLEFLHMSGFVITRDEPVFIGNVVVVPHVYAEGSPRKSPNIYFMYPDGSKIWWVLEPYPLNLD